MAWNSMTTCAKRRSMCGNRVWRSIRISRASKPSSSSGKRRSCSENDFVKRVGSLQILFQDQTLVAVNKPAALATIPGRGETTSVLQELAHQLGLPCAGESDSRLRVVHRLDKGTSGALLFAKNLLAQRHVSHQ